MVSHVRGWGCLLVALATASCGDDATGSGGGASTGDGGSGATGGPSTSDGVGGAASTGAGPGGGDAAASTGAGGGDALDWTPLLTGEWQLDTGEEITSQFFTITAERDILVGAIRPIAPLGTHHTVLALGGFTTGNYIYASGVDTNELVFPEGVGLRIPAGEDVVLQLHIYNPTPGPLTGTSGIEIVELTEDDVVNEAEIFLPGPLDLSIPPQQEHTRSGTCTVSAPQTLFALFPHMHQLGTHFRTTVSVGGEEITLHDAPYEFEHQPFFAFDPIELAPGDSIETECTWINPGEQTVGWGESSDSEMCFSILYRWPVLPGEGFCP